MSVRGRLQCQIPNSSASGFLKLMARLEKRINEFGNFYGKIMIQQTNKLVIFDVVMFFFTFKSYDLGTLLMKHPTYKIQRTTITI